MATVNDTQKLKKGRARKYKSCVCGFVGYGTNDFPSNAGGLCCTCWKIKQTEKRLKNNSPCKVCGKLTPNHKGRVTCSPECSEIHNQRSKVEKRIDVECCVCGKSVVRYKNELKTRDRFCCSLMCQRKLITKKDDVDWIKRSKKEKESFKRKRSIERRRANKWWRIIAKKLRSSKLRRTNYDSWRYRIQLRLNVNKGRVVRRKLSYRCSVSVEDALARVIQKRKYFELSDWEKKIGSKLSSHKARRSKKNANRETEKDLEKAHEGFTHSQKYRNQRKQMCFEWLAD